jgi:hypothetical protein
VLLTGNGALFFYTWRRPLEWGVLGLGLLVLLVIPTVSLAAVVLVVLLGGFLVGTIELIAGPRDIDDSVPADQDAESVDAH